MVAPTVRPSLTREQQRREWQLRTAATRLRLQWYTQGRFSTPLEARRYLAQQWTLGLLRIGRIQIPTGY